MYLIKKLYIFFQLKFYCWNYLYTLKETLKYNISLFKKYGTIEPSFDKMIDILSDKNIFSKKTSLKSKINLIDSIDYYKSL